MCLNERNAVDHLYSTGDDNAEFYSVVRGFDATASPLIWGNQTSRGEYNLWLGAHTSTASQRQKKREDTIPPHMRPNSECRGAERCGTLPLYALE